MTISRKQREIPSPGATQPISPFHGLSEQEVGSVFSGIRSGEFVIVLIPWDKEKKIEFALQFIEGKKEVNKK